MNSRSRRLRPLVQLAGHREHTAAKELGRSQNSEQTLLKKLEALLQYRDEYAQKQQARAAEGCPVAELRRYQIFVARVDDAIKTQQQLIQQAKLDVQRKREGWKHLNGRKRSVELAQGKMVHREALERSRTEQKESDQTTSERHNSARPPGSGRTLSKS